MKRAIILGLGILILVVIYINLIKKSKQFPNLSTQTLFTDITEDDKALGYPGQKKMVSDNLGNVYFTYRKKYQGNYEVYVAKVNNNGDENLVERVSSIGDTPQRVSSIVIDGNQNLHLVWYGADPGTEKDNRQIKYSVSNNQGSSWSDWVNIAPVAGYQDKYDLWQEHPDILVGTDGKLYVVWEGKDQNNKNQQIKISSSSDHGKTWANWRNILEEAQFSQSRPSILEDTQGNLHVLIYGTEEKKTSHIFHSISKDRGATWSKWQNISDPLLGSKYVNAVVDEMGYLHAVWVDKPFQGEAISYSVFDGNSWSVPESKLIAGSFDIYPSISTDGKNINLVWVENQSSGLWKLMGKTSSFGLHLQSLTKDTQNPFSDSSSIRLLDQGSISYPYIFANQYVSYLKRGSEIQVVLKSIR